MKLKRSLWIHGIILAAASGLAFKTWTRDETALTQTSDQVPVWKATVEQLESLRFESPKTLVSIVAHKDAAGRWYEVRVGKPELPTKAPQKTKAPSDSAENAPTDENGADEETAENAPEAPSTAEPPAVLPSAPESSDKASKDKVFVSVTEGGELAESLAPLMALRAVGRVEEDREKEFGFDEPAGTLIVRIAGKEHTLILGGLTPGGADRYARVKESGEVFAVSGEILRRLEQAEHRLFERDLLFFEEEKTPTAAKIVGGDRSREIVAVDGKVGGWANSSTPTDQDETVSNWMGKLDKLRVKSYLEGTEAIAGKTPFLVVEYFHKGSPTRRVELYKLPGSEAPESEGDPEPQGARYVARSDHSRWPVELVGTGGADLEQDLPSLFE